MSTARHNHAATLLPNGKVLVVGGHNGSGLSSAELYDPASNTWSAASSMVTARYGLTATLLPNGKVLVAGGHDGVGSFPSVTELYDPATNTWSTSGNMVTARYTHTATLLPNGNVLVAGGYGGGVLASAELYDPTSNTWSAAGSMATVRSSLTAALLPNGKVLVTGGDGGSGAVTSADLFDPTSNTWSTAGSMITSRSSIVTAPLLPNGKVLMAGGYSGSNAVASAELYDPATNTWSAAAGLAAARYANTTTLLPSGKVLVAGGYGGGGLTSSELYNAATNIWSTTASLAAARYGHTATLLPSGEVLVAGGYNGNSTLASAELFTPSDTIKTYALSISLSGLGTVTSSPSGINCDATCSANFSSGTNLTLTATPASGYSFSGWSGACTGTSSCSLTIDAAKSVGVVFGTPTVATGTATTVASIAAHRLSYGSTSLAVRNDGTIWSWGYNGTNNLGYPYPGSRSRPTQITSLSDIVLVASSSATSAAIKSDGTVWTWGTDFTNAYGQLGSGSNTPSNIPVKALISDVSQVAMNNYNTLFLKMDGTVWGTGRNHDGELGDGTTSSRNFPGRVPSLNGVVQIAVGHAYVLALRSDGTVWSWGLNKYGSLGDGTFTNRLSPVQVSGLRDVVAIAADITATALALKSDGTVWAWGLNVSGAVGDGTYVDRATPVLVEGLNNVIAIAAGKHSSSFALRSDGTVWSWGYWQTLGDGSTVDRPVPGPVNGLSNVIAISGAMALRSDGTLWTWGPNHYGELGNGTLGLRNIPGVVLNETLDGPLDLFPEIANNIPSEYVPPFSVATYKLGELDSVTFYADLRSLKQDGTFASVNASGRFATGYNVYVGAAVPSGTTPLYFQLDSNRSWSPLTWPMAEFMRGVSINSQDQVRVEIIQNLNLTGLVGAEILVGYGTDFDEMLRSNRYQKIFTVSDETIGDVIQ